MKRIPAGATLVKKLYTYQRHELGFSDGGHGELQSSFRAFAQMNVFR